MPSCARCELRVRSIRRGVTEALVAWFLLNLTTCNGLDPWTRRRAYRIGAAGVAPRNGPPARPTHTSGDAHNAEASLYRSTRAPDHPFVALRGRRRLSEPRVQEPHRRGASTTRPNCR